MITQFLSVLVLFAASCLLQIRADNNLFCEAGIGYGESGCQTSKSSSSKILIKGGTVVNAHHQEVADVYVEDGVIVAVQPNLKVVLPQSLTHEQLLIKMYSHSLVVCFICFFTAWP